MTRLPLRLDFEDDRPDPFVGMMRFARDLLAARQDRFEAAERHGGSTTLRSLNDPVHHLPDLLLVFVDQRIAFGFADLLDDDLLGGLRSDAADHLLGVERLAVAAGVDRAVFAGDPHHDVRFLAVLAFGGGDQRRLDGLEHDLRVNVLVPVQRVDDAQQLIWIHGDLVFCLGFTTRHGTSRGASSRDASPHILTRSSIKKVARVGSNPTATSCPSSTGCPAGTSTANSLRCRALASRPRPSLPADRAAVRLPAPRWPTTDGPSNSVITIRPVPITSVAAVGDSPLRVGAEPSVLPAAGDVPVESRTSPRHRPAEPGAAAAAADTDCQPVRDEPSGAALTATSGPGIRFIPGAPRNSATRTFAGRSYTSRGGPVCWIRPPSITTNAIAQRQGFCLVVRDVHHGGADALVQSFQFLPHVDSQLRVEMRQRFIQQKRRRSADDGSSQRDSLALAPGQLPGHPIQQVVDAQDSAASCTCRAIACRRSLGRWASAG